MALLLLLLVLLVTGTSFLLGAVNNRQELQLAQQAELLNQMQIAKENLLAYAAHSHFLNSNQRGPGFFPCPDTDNDDAGLPDCISSADVLAEPIIGRLPQHLSNGASDMEFNTYYAGIDQQFWYVVAPRYYYNSDSDPLVVASRVARDRTSKSSTYSNLRMSLDGMSGYVVLIIAPGEALGTQDRSTSPEEAANYIESQDSTLFAFQSTVAAPSTTNDVIVGITLNEYMMAVGPTAANEMKKQLDAAGSPYTASQSTFRGYLNNTGDHAWLRTSGTYNGERWRSYVTYTQTDTTTADIRFTGCNITFTLDKDDGISRTGTTC